MKNLFLVLFVLALAIGASGQTSEVTFERIKIADLGSILIPSTMELQTGTYKELSNSSAKETLKKQELEISGNKIIFQPKGLNESKKVDKYARVTITTEIGAKGNFGKITSRISITKPELKIIDSQAKKQIEEGLAGTGIKIVRWDGVSVVNINGKSAMKTAYLRQLKDTPEVYIEMYHFENSDRTHLLTISYRVSDVPSWKDALETTKNSFSITNIR